MRTVISGAGVNTTATVAAALASDDSIYQADLFLFGEADDPLALRLTDWETALVWSQFGTFQPAVLKRGSISSSIGLDSKTLEVTWSPALAPVFTTNISTTSYYALAQLGTCDHWRFRLWRCLMPTPGDANTWGAYELFGGVVGQIEVGRTSIRFTIADYPYVFDQKVPSAVIEVTNTLASYTGGTPPSGFSTLPVCSALASSTTTTIDADCVTTPGHIFTTNALANGYLVWKKGSTLAGLYSIISSNSNFTVSSVQHNRFTVYSPFPWAPTAGDQFYISGESPIDQADGDYYGFPYVPAPETAA